MTFGFLSTDMKKKSFKVNYHELNKKFNFHPLQVTNKVFRIKSILLTIENLNK